MMIVLFAWLLVFAQTAAPAGLVGRWDAETRSRGGLGTWIELADRGVCSRTIGAMVDGTWKLEGDQLTVSIPIPDGPPVVRRGTSSINGTKQTQVFEGQANQLTRRGAAPDSGSGIVGIWSYPHPTGPTAYEEYTIDGRMLFRLPMTSERCRWSSETDRLTLGVGSDANVSQWHIAGVSIPARW
jgi:hypothetical protein